mmetsp:Transcript_14881/g.13081  ORF Transcript_14881/g.13081 Transcript_14881/m.13081 type:complete len:179 (+) Transcript_14881:651-1187(+)
MVILFTQQIMSIIGYIYFMNTYFPSWIILTVLIPICMFFNMKSISYISLFALVMMSSGLIFILGFSISDFSHNESYGEIEYFRLSGLPLFYGISMFMFEGDSIIINVEDSMKKPKDFFKVSFFSMIIITVIGLVIAVLPYLAYLGSTSDIIINSLNNDEIRIYLKIAYTLAVAGTIPI